MLAKNIVLLAVSVAFHRDHVDVCSESGNELGSEKTLILGLRSAGYDSE